MKFWRNGQITDGKGELDSLNFSLHYASPTAWEGIRSYTQHDGSTSVFCLEAHVNRLLDTAKINDFTIPYTKDEIINAIEEVVKANGGGDLYIRPIAYTMQDAKSTKPQPSKINLDIYAFPISALHGKDNIKMAISNLIRGYPQFQMQAKTSANYSVLQSMKQQTTALNVDDMFLLDNQGYVVEAKVANFFVIKGDVIMTPPDDGSILPGITRQNLFNILQNLTIMELKYKRRPDVKEKRITRADLYTADAVVICGTLAEVINVTEIDGRNLTGSPYVAIMQNEYQKLVRGTFVQEYIELLQRPVTAIAGALVGTGSLNSPGRNNPAPSTRSGPGLGHIRPSGDKK